MSESKFEEIYQLLESSINMLEQGVKLQHKAMLKLLTVLSDTNTRTNNLINYLAAPEQGEIYSVDDIAKILKVSRATVYKWVQSGKIPHTKPNGGKVIFYKHQLSEFFYQKQNE